MTRVLELLMSLRAGLGGLGRRQLIALGLMGVTVFAVVGVSGYLLSRPQMEVLYSGLDAADVTSMGAALQEAGIAFDVSVDGGSVLVAIGEGSKARMLLAQKGLPRSDAAGYELFDKLGSLGLTTFMQQITKVRALEGELAKTIRLIDGVKTARVHLALRSEGSFRQTADQATASVIIRADDAAGNKAASAIRQLVAAAIPGLSASQVIVMSADGQLLTPDGDPTSAVPEKLIGLERSLSSDIEARVTRTLLPYVGYNNFRVSVSAKLNADRKQISETVFDPNSRVERSVRTIKESGQSQNATSAPGVSVEQNIPAEEVQNGTGDNSSERKDRKEELTNYEINTKSVSTTSDGYQIDKLTIAVVLNRAALFVPEGGTPSDEDISSRIRELERVIITAAGLDTVRGDSIAVTAVEFRAEEDLGISSSDGEGLGALISQHFGSLVNAIALLISVVLITFAGLRPALRLILGDRSQPRPMQGGLVSEIASNPAGMPVADMSVSTGALDELVLPQLGANYDPLLDDLVREVSSSPKDRLAKIVELDPERAVEVMKQWLSDVPGRAA